MSYVPRIFAKIIILRLYNIYDRYFQFSMVAMEKKYSAVLIGSSGGGTATLGHTNPVELLETVHKELRRLGSDEKGQCIGLSHAIFVSLCNGSGFDSIQKENWLPRNNSNAENGGPIAKLYSVGFHNDNVDNQEQETTERLNVHTLTGPLPAINFKAKQLDAKLSKILHNNNALISVSSEPTNIHAESLRSCSRLSIPVTGSGGTSISNIAELYNLPIIRAQGSVASTTVTKSRGWAMGLALVWRMTYDYIVDDIRDNTTQGEDAGGETATPLPSLKSILESTLPSFLFVCIFLRFFNGGTAMNNTTMKIEYCLRYYVPGISCSILAATSRDSSSTHRSSQDLSTTLLSSALAGVLSSASSQLDDIHEGGSALAGLLAGSLVPLALSFVSNLCVKHNVTATMTNLVCGGGVGMIVGMIMHWSSTAYVLSVFTGWVRCLIRWKQISMPETNILVKTIANALMRIQLAWNDFASSASMAKFIHATTDVSSNEFLPIPRGLGFLIGCIFVYGSKIGWYHSIFLPLIMLEMDSSTREEAASLLGAIDECTLVMVCAGICAGNLASSRRHGGNKSLSWQALKTNILCGDFIEACYPSMEKSRLVNAFAYLAAGTSTEIIVRQRVLSSAYVPLPISVLISNDRWGMIAASSVSFGISFVGSLIANQINSVTMDKKGS